MPNVSIIYQAACAATHALPLGGTGNQTCWLAEPRKNFFLLLLQPRHDLLKGKFAFMQ